MNDKKFPPRRAFLLFAVISSLVVVLATLYGLAVLFLPTSFDPAGDLISRGAFGDTFGALNTVFSGLALAAVATTLWLQTKELESQRKTNDSQQVETRTQIRLLRREISTLQLRAYFDAIRFLNELQTEGNEFLRASGIDREAHIRRLEDFIRILSKQLDEIPKPEPGET